MDTIRELAFEAVVDFRIKCLRLWPGHLEAVIAGKDFKWNLTIGWNDSLGKLWLTSTPTAWIRRDRRVAMLELLATINSSLRSGQFDLKAIWYGYANFESSALVLKDGVPSMELIADIVHRHRKIVEHCDPGVAAVLAETMSPQKAFALLKGQKPGVLVPGKFDQVSRAVTLTDPFDFP